MAKAYVFFNPLAGNGQYLEKIDTLKNSIPDEIISCDMTKEDSYDKIIKAMDNEDYLVICGGDGTLNRFVNTVSVASIPNDILYFPCGSGNDFAREFDKQNTDAPFSIKSYIEKLPTVTIDDKTSYFINIIGYGIDGYCCEMGDKAREASTKPVNYTAIAIKGLLFDYKPTDAKVTVDGVTTEFKKVWIAPAVNGKYYGGGMMPAPEHDRSNPEGNLSVAILHGSSALKTLMIFPGIFKGAHAKHKKHVTILQGKEITVEYTEPRAVQIDGETVVNVSRYTARSKVLVKEEETIA